MPKPIDDETTGAGTAETAPAGNAAGQGGVPLEAVYPESGATGAAAETTPSGGAPSGTNSTTGNASQGTRADAGQGGGTPADGWQGARDYVEQQLGLAGVSQRFESDEQLLTHLVNEARRAQELAQYASYGQQVLPHLDKFQSFLAQQQAEAQAKSAEQDKKWWSPPPFDPRWREHIEPTATGGWKLKEGGDPQALAGYQKHAEFRQQWAERLMSDPEAALGQMIEARARKVAEDLVGTKLGEQSDALYLQNFLRENTGWLHQKDQGGQTVYNQAGQPILSPAGARYVEHVREAESLGIKDRNRQEVYARRLLNADLQASQAPQAAAAGANDAAKAKVTQANRKTAPNHAGSLQGVQGAGTQVPAAQNERLSLRDMLLADFAAAGITDKDIAGDE